MCDDTRLSSQDEINDIVRRMFVRTEARTERALSISEQFILYLPFAQVFTTVARIRDTRANFRYLSDRTTALLTK